jgi:periplasmic divalent cation tolerance protein
MNVVILFSAFPNLDAARVAALTLVEEKLVACVNVINGVESIYRWQGAIEQSAEVMVMCKTTDAMAGAAMARLRALHPYEVPEILTVPASGGWPDYVKWVEENSCGRE